MTDLLRPAGLVKIKREATAPPDEHPLLRWRHDHGMTLARMAERAGSSAASLSRIEHDKQIPSYRLIRRLGVITRLAPEIFLDRLSCNLASDDGAASPS